MSNTLADDSGAFEAALNFVDEYFEADTNSSAIPPSSDVNTESSDAEEASILTFLVLPTDIRLEEHKGEQESSDAISRAESAIAEAKTKKQESKKTKKSSKRQRPPNYKPNRARDQRRKELIYLREKVGELEQNLVALQGVRGTKALALLGGDGRGVCSTVWKEMAGTQLEERLKVEHENRRLKAVLEGQIKIGKSLQKLLVSSSATQSMESCIYGPQRTQRIHTSAPDRTGSIKFTELMAGMGDSYRKVDDVWRTTGLADKDYSYNDANMREGLDGIYMEMLASKMLPFDVLSTGSAAWEYFTNSLEHRPYRFCYQKEPQNMETTDDTIIEKFGMELHWNGAQADFSVKQIVRRYVEEDRVVIIWRAFIDPVEFLGTPLRGADFREEGYLVVRTPRTRTPGVALLQTCYIITPETPVYSLSDEGAITGALTDFVLSGTAANIAAGQQLIENILFNQAVKAHSGQV